MFDLIETIAQRSAYLALLAEYPDTLARVARMVAASPWAAQYLTQHPLLLDSLIDWRTLPSRWTSARSRASSPPTWTPAACPTAIPTSNAR